MNYYVHSNTIMISHLLVRFKYLLYDDNAIEIHFTLLADVFRRYYTQGYRSYFYDYALTYFHWSVKRYDFWKVSTVFLFNEKIFHVSQWVSYQFLFSCLTWYISCLVVVDLDHYPNINFEPFGKKSDMFPRKVCRILPFIYYSPINDKNKVHKKTTTWPEK